ncbi:MAG TPA: iron-containing alcohol dehydrogenase [Rectinemataceae bacterium]|nr:iron-containing alcohol dehydrogenase [Rectinemataceae bacterium]
MNFEFATAARILFGPGSVREVGAAARAFGSRAFVLHGRDPGRARVLLDLLSAAGLVWEARAVAGEPSFEELAAALAQARAFGAELVLGFGGGSCIDAAKAVAALLANPGEILDYAEVIGAGKPLTAPSLPCIALPTTAGTGSEVTRNAVLSSAAHRVKVSLRSPTMLPRLAIVDPELARDLPPAATASTGMDALTQLIEPFVSRRANPLTDSLCRDGIGRAFACLPRAFRDGHDAAAREGMALASLESTRTSEPDRASSRGRGGEGLRYEGSRKNPATAARASDPSLPGRPTIGSPEA